MAAWGLAPSPLTPLKGGHRGQVLASATHVFKSTQLPDPALRWLDPVKAVARRAGFEVPEHLDTRDGQRSHRGWTCAPRLQLSAASPEDLAEAQARIGWLHRQSREMPQRPGFLASTAYTHNAHGREVDLRILPPALAQACLRAFAALPKAPLCAIHADLHRGNLGRTPQGTLALLDWTEARLDLPLFDLPPPDQISQTARMAWEMACCWHAEPQRARQIAQDSFGWS